MRRAKLLAYLEKHGCYLVREGGKHSVYHNPAAERSSTVPRHSEVIDILARKICKDLGIPAIRNKK